MRWDNSVPSNLFWIAGIRVDRSSDKQVLTVFGTDSGIDCRNTLEKKFQVIIALSHSAFITSQSLFGPTNMVLKRYLACRTFNKVSAIQQ